MMKNIIGILFLCVVLSGCAQNLSSHDPSASSTTAHSDPFESFNRKMFDFNYNVLDPYLVRPVAVIWRDYVPQPARNGMMNFFNNLSEPAAMVNNFLKGDPYDGMKHFTRFFLNTLLGMGGLIDVASMANPSQLGNIDETRFSSVLAYYDVGTGPYLVLPFYGSFTPREDVAEYVDDLYPPLSLLTFWMYVGKWTLEGINARARLLDSDALIKTSSDPYAFVRSAYFQHLRFKTHSDSIVTEINPNNAIIASELDDID